MTPSKESPLRNIPSVEILLHDEAVIQAAPDLPRGVLLSAVRAAVDAVRRRILADPQGEWSEAAIRAAIVEGVSAEASSAKRSAFRRAVNATGIILHTGLGRAVLAPAAMQQIQRELSGYSLLQLDIETGARSQRDARIEALLRTLTGAEAATLVNNNAAATMLVLNTLGKGREVIVSRGQLVEIGGSFRLPDVMAASGATMVEVGTTNKTHLRDYEDAINERTAAILRVHPSNYRVVGFSEEAPLADLIAVAHKHNIPLIDDVGAGALIDFSRFGFSREPTLRDSLAAGSDIVTASGDKLIGGAQSGLVLGRTALIKKVRKNPIARMVRVDKITLSAMEATLSLFLDEAQAMREVPTLAMLALPLEGLAKRAEAMRARIAAKSAAADAAVIDGFSQMGSGSFPGQDLPTALVALSPKVVSVDELALRLRRSEPPVFARIQDDRVLIDPRTLQSGEDEIVVRAVIDALEEAHT